MKRNEKKRKKVLEAEIALEMYKRKKKEFIDQNQSFSKWDILKPKLKYPFTKQLLKAITLFQHEKIEYLNQKNIKIPKGRRVIYANTHRFKPDFEKITIATKKASFVVASDFKNAYKTINGWYFNTRPTIFVDPDSVEDKNNSFLLMVKYLNAGLDGMIFPEAVWNFSENRIVLDTFFGTVKAALMSNSVIVCTAIERYDKKYVINRKGYFDPSLIVKKYTQKEFKDLNEKDEKEKEIYHRILVEANTIMRNELATLLMEIFKAKNRVEKRDEIPSNYWEEYIESLMKEWPGYKLEDNKNQQYQNKEILKQQQVENDLYAILKNPNSSNFFMGMSNKRFENYMSIKSNLEQIQQDLLEMREKNNNVEEIPLEKRLELYKRKKQQKQEE